VSFSSSLSVSLSLRVLAHVHGGGYGGGAVVGPRRTGWAAAAVVVVEGPRWWWWKGKGRAQCAVVVVEGVGAVYDALPQRLEVGDEARHVEPTCQREKGEGVTSLLCLLGSEVFF